MTAQMKWRRLLATATTGLLVASGLAIAPAVANAADEVPTVTVSKTADVNPEGETVTVSGSGFLPSAPATSGTRPPLANKFTGTYVAFGYFAETWQPSLGAAGSARKTYETKWAVNAEDMETIGGADAGAIELRADGTFETQLTIKQEDVSALATGGRFGVYTYPGGGAKYAPFETYTPVSFAAPAATPVVTSSINGASAETGLSIAVEASGLPSDVTSAYAAVIEKGTAAALEDPSSPTIAFAVPFPAVSNGSSSFTLNAPTEKLDRNKQYEVLVWKLHSAATPANIYALGDISVSSDQWDAVFPAQPEAVPTVKAAVTSATKEGLKVKFDLANVDSPVGAYISVFENGQLSQLGQESMGVAADWLTASKFTNNAASGTLTLPKAKLDRKKTYQFAAWQAHTNPTADTVYAMGTLRVTSGQWDAVFPVTTPPTPKPTPTFTDVKKGAKFYKEISWMASEGISTGVRQPNGTYQYQPKNNVTREAMAAFLFRQYGDSSYKAPKTSYFSDIKPGDKFYKEISWMYASKTSTGVKQASGKPAYLAKAGITREAMAAFMYRLDKNAKPATPKASPFTDVKAGDKFYKEIAWMSQSGLSTGIKQPNGTRTYAAKSNVTREAMAAFLYRADH
ncbi:S-layer homology domain-containing protein [Leucobacter sp. L43]|uniref:S-layer homology domain-containing protein n=1 Tax=Leucobacter sp. L43 TaxID=2798040 RepID=UPI001907E649|nr:S-layer homology domain-containing protein [Leucobacter sp. L43]